MEQPIFLIGMMGAGKSHIGQRLATRLSVPFIDTDTEIEKLAGQSIPQVFREEGEASFREWERKWVTSWQAVPAVVSTGGGLPTHHQLMRQLKALGMVIYLSIDASLAEDRLTGSNRPLWKGKEAWAALLQERETIYRQAHYTLDAARAEEDLLHDLIAITQSR